MRNRVTPIRYVHAGSPDFSSDFYNLVLDTPGTLKSEGVDMHGLYARMLSENGLLAASDEEMNALSPGIRMVLNAVHSAHMSLIHQVQRLLPLVRVYEGAWIDRMTQKETMRVFYDEREWRGASFGDEKALRFKFEDVRYLVVQLLGQRNQPTLLPGSYVQAASRDDFQQVDFRDR